MLITDVKKLRITYTQLIGVLVCVVTFFVTISLYSYRLQDPSWCYYTSDNGITLNWCGSTGAQVAAIFFYLFGGAVWVLMLFLSFIGFLLLSNRSWAQEWERIISFAVLIVVTATLCRMHKLNFFPGAFAGGYVGNLVYSSMYTLDYMAGAFFLYTVMSICLVLLLRFSFMPLVHYVICAFRAVYLFCVRYQVVQQSYRVIKAGTVLIILKPLRACVYFLKQLLDGSLFEGTQLMIPDNDALSQNSTGHEQLLSNAQANEARPLKTYSLRSKQPTIQSDSNDRAESHRGRKVEQDAVAIRYALPDLDVFIGVDDRRDDAVFKRELETRAKVLEEKLERFGVFGRVIAIKSGPVVTLFEYQPQIDTKISKILALEDDLALALQALSIRIIAPIPGRSVVGFEVANNQRKDVLLANVIQSPEYQTFSGTIPLILGEDTVGNNVIVDLIKMPHLLIAGSTGSGKSVALNTMLMSLLCKRSPDELKLILIDPKRLEFASYADVAHLLFPIVTEPKQAIPVLRWVVKEMEKRYEKMAMSGVRSIVDYNSIDMNADERLPFIVIVIDELSDLMMTVGRDIEDLITRITQMARAAGIHMIVATQRPSVDVITGLIKVNFPSRISFRVTSKVDSKTILDCGGADKLLGRGDMLFLDSTTSVLKRVHGAYVSDYEINQVVEHIHAEQAVEYRDLSQELIVDDQRIPEEDEYLYQQIVSFLQEIDEVSISLLQRKFRIGYNRSARIIDMLESRGLIMPTEGGRTRKVIR